MKGAKKSPPRPLIVGLAGPVLSAADHYLLRRIDPAGVILFRRNIVDPAQTKRLTTDIAESLNTQHPIILVDQEGGRVRRLSAPPWPAFPAAGSLFKHALGLGGAAYLQGRLMGQTLAHLGISVNCAPVLDVRDANGHDGVMGDRCFGQTPEMVQVGGQAIFAGQNDSGLVSVIKHMPVHGRTRVDSHYDLPVIDAPLSALQTHDFAPFRHFAALKEQRLWGMTAHVLIPEIDAKLPATLSKPVIDRIIRGDIGFDGISLSDDLEMGALTGTIAARITQSLDAGCDAVLHCSVALGALATNIGDVAPMPEPSWDRMCASLEAARAAAKPALNPDEYQQKLAMLIDNANLVSNNIDPTQFQPAV